MRLREIVAIAKKCGWVETGTIVNPDHPEQTLGIDASGRTAACFYTMVVEEATNAGWEPVDRKAKTWQDSAGKSAEQFLEEHRAKLAEARKGSLPLCGSYASGLSGYNDE